MEPRVRLAERAQLCLSEQGLQWGNARCQGRAPRAPPSPARALTSSTSFTPSGGTFFLLPWLWEKWD